MQQQLQPPMIGLIQKDCYLLMSPVPAAGDLIFS